MSLNRMNHRELQLYKLGFILEKAIDRTLGKDEEYRNWLWLVTLMEEAARADPETASFALSIRRLLNDPRIPF